MNKGLKAYLRMGIQGSKKVVKERRTSIFKFYFLYFATLFSYLLVFPAPIFIQANISMNKQNSEKQTYELTKVFADNDNPKVYWTNLLCLIIKVILFISGILCIGLVAFILYSAGGILEKITEISDISILLVIPAIIVLVIYVCGFNLVFAPLFYYINTYPDISISKALNASIRTMKEQGKITLFFMTFFHLLLTGLYAGIIYFLYNYTNNQTNETLKIIFYIILVLLIVSFIYVLPKLGLIYRIAKFNLMQDILIDPSLPETKSFTKEKMIKQGLSKDEFLMNLFDKKIEESNEKEEENNTEVKAVEESEEKKEK